MREELLTANESMQPTRHMHGGLLLHPAVRIHCGVETSTN